MLEPVHGFVANTDYEWFTFLRERQQLNRTSGVRPLLTGALRSRRRARHRRGRGDYADAIVDVRRTRPADSLVTVCQRPQ